MVGWMVGLDGESQFREEKKKKKKKRKTNPNLLSLPSTPSLVFNTVARHFTNPVKPTPAAVSGDGASRNTTSTILIHTD